jgi:hypothetical protein
MAVYNLEITSSSLSKKALKFIANETGFSEKEIEERLQLQPLVIKEHLPLTEAIELERHLKLLGAATRLIRLDEEPEEELTEPTIVDSEVLDEPPELKTVEDVIEIPEEDIKVLHPYDSTEPVQEFKRKKVRIGGRNTWFAVTVILVVVILVSWYIITLTNRHQLEMEIELAINQWETAVKQQEILLDKDFPPERIFYKLDQLDASIERMLARLKPFAKSDALRSRFYETKSREYNLVRDLTFRRVLEENGYPIHPTCLIDRSMVQGTSDLPESTLLRIQLLSRQNVESVYYAARISAGTFRLSIDPNIEYNVYDARATVAAYSQQPREIQRWAERKFSVTELASRYLPKPIYAPQTAAQTIAPSNVPSGDTAQSRLPIRGGTSLADPGSDQSRGMELERCLTEWTETIISSQRQDLLLEQKVLEKIYLRLLDLEVRINQLIGLLESAMDRNQWIERREEVFGSFIGARQEIEVLYGQDLKNNSPLRLEGRISLELRDRNLLNAEVLVVESPSNPESYVIELDVGGDNKDEIFVATAEVLANAILNSSLSVERISLHFAGGTIRWSTEQILRAAAALEEEGGQHRCVTLMELSGIEHTMP